MIKDEFNNIEITNDKQTKLVEFGKTQKAEFTSKKENTVPEGELNEKFVGKTIKQTTEVNVEYINKVPSHTTTTVVKTATTATNVASAAASTVVVASTVAVTAVAVATGISVAIHDYHCELSSLLISSNAISYSFTIVDYNKDDSGIDYQTYEENPKGLLKTDRTLGGPEEEPYYENDFSNPNRPFVLKVSNANYVSEHYLDYGKSEEDSFSGLTLGDTYEITLSENRYGGEVLYHESFTTFKNSYCRYFYLSSYADFRNGTLWTEVDYLDELENLNSFNLNLTAKDDSTFTYQIPLEVKTGYQELSVSDFDFTRTYDFVFSYKKGEDVIEFSTGEINFIDSNTGVSEVYGVNWDKTANFVTKEIALTLDYQDDFDIFSQFELELQDAEYPEEVTEVFTLVKTTDEQIITIPEDSSIYLRRAYKYQFSYLNAENNQRSIIESGEVTFVDNSNGQKAFNSCSIDPVPNYENKTFTVTLDYVDDYSELVSFALEMHSDDTDSVTIYLNETTEPQVISAADYDIDFLKTYTYTLTYYDIANGEQYTAAEGSITFDTSSLTSTFNQLIFDKTANFNDRSFVVQLDFIDELNVFSQFKFTLNAIDKSETIEYGLEKTTEPQTLYADEMTSGGSAGTDYRIDLVYDNMTYSLSYYDARTEETIVAVPETEVSFTNSVHSVFNDLESSFDFTEEASGTTYMLPVHFDYDDLAHSYYSFDVSFWKNDEEVGYLVFEGYNLSDEWQYGVYTNVDSTYDVDGIINTSGVYVKVVANYDMDSDPNLPSSEEVFYKEVALTKGEVKQVHGAYVRTEYLHYGGEIMLSVVYSGGPDDLGSQLVIETYNNNTYIYNFELSIGNNYSMVVLSETDDSIVLEEEQFVDELIDHPVKLSLRYCTYYVDYSDPAYGSDGQIVPSDYITMVIADSYKFSLSV